MDPFVRRRWIAGSGFVVCAVVVVVLVARATRSPDTEGTATPDPKPETGADVVAASTSPFLNAQAKVAYVGSQACLECHRDAHETYLKTAHSRALAPADPKTEPEGTTYFHEKSGRRYSVFEKDGVIRHRESIPDGDGELIINEYPVKYVIGSGHHSRSYLFEVDGFLNESPITWYARKQAWAMSPGYDRPDHQSFKRAASLGCVACHAGQVASIDKSLNRLRVHEQVIGCENCHGPGSLHVARRKKEASSDVAATGPAEIDHSIVNPAHLSRELRESVCSQCHLRGAATVFVRGRGITDFRPGLPLTDFQVDYRFANDDGSMKVTGHVEQMRQSRCYTESKTMTCTTCHNPHSRPEPAERIAHYRTKCQSCHDPDTDDCKLPTKTRLKKNPQNNCVACHMPQSSTDIPHFAFTHHRVGLNHKTEYKEARLTGREKIVPVNNISQLSESERLRCLGLAYLEIGDLHPGPAADGFYDQAYRILQQAHSAGARDADVLSGLARISWVRNLDVSVTLAKQALAADNGSAQSRINALFVLGNMQRQIGESVSAEKTFERLVTLRRNESDWLHLGFCRQNNGDQKGAIEAFLTAASISPDDASIQMKIATAYREAGDTKSARKHTVRAERLEKLLASPRPKLGKQRNLPRRE